MEGKFKNRREMLKTLALGGAAVAVGGPLLNCDKPGDSPVKRPDISSKRPNIIFVFTDDHASHAISAYGSRINKTPNIDRIAREGTLFHNCFVTNSICAPSRAVILTGKHSHLNSVPTNRETFDGSQQTFPKLLQKAGYQTAIIGKWHLKSDPTGFDFWRVLIGQGGQGTYYNPQFGTPGGDEKIIGYTTDVITDLTLDWLQNGRDPEKPFMLMCQHKAPHREWEPGPDHLTMYDDTMIPEPPTLFDDYKGRSSAAKTQEMTIAGHFNDRDMKFTPPDNLTDEQLKKWNEAYEPKNRAFKEAGLTGDDLVRWKYQRYLKDYLRCIASVDDNIGRILDWLDQSGLAENTVVIYNSDQGFYLGDHGWYDKRWMYEESLRMPLVVRWPGVIEPGSENHDLVQNLDFAETFLDIAGLQAPVDMQGSSIVPLLKGRTPSDWRSSVYYHYYEFPSVHMVNRHYGVRTERYKLIYFYLLDQWELYDLQRDPQELRSLYGNPFYADVVKDLKTELQRLRKLYKVPETDPVPYPES
ncbi:MAG: sulfatase-like hydrolase/transferase [Gemmatimonadota bacterium]|nr:sulfatase-like hydrolase/transferase [Gemmatimonadota bacterium]